MFRALWIKRADGENRVHSTSSRARRGDGEEGVRMKMKGEGTETGVGGRSLRGWGGRHDWSKKTIDGINLGDDRGVPDAAQ